MQITYMVNRVFQRVEQLIPPLEIRSSIRQAPLFLSRMRKIKSIRFENLMINGKVISDDMAGKPAWYKTSDMARFFVGEHVGSIVFTK